MRTQSSEKKPKLQLVGNVIYLWWDEQVLPSQPDHDELGYSYFMIKVLPVDDRGSIVEKIVKLKYPTYDKEIAALANQDSEHASWRQEAKILADEALEFRGEA